MPSASDKELIRAARKGDRQAANLLAERYWQNAWKASFALSGNREIANDATQDAFERILRTLRRVDEHRPFGAYLHRIVINRTLDLLRGERRRADLDPQREPDGDHQIERSLDAMAFESRVSQLPEDRRIPVVLRFLLGYRPSEIAEMLDLPEGTVNSRIARGVEQLRRSMGGEGR